MVRPNKILVIRRKAIGDVLVSMAVVIQLKTAWPDSEIHLIVDKFAAPVVEGHPAVDKLIIFDPKLASRGGIVTRLRETSRWLCQLGREKYDVVLDLLSTPGTAIWTLATRAPIRVGSFRRKRSFAYTHLVDTKRNPVFNGETMLRWLKPLSLEPTKWKPTPTQRGEVNQTALIRKIHAQRNTTGPTVILNPSASWPAKGWPIEHFSKLALILQDRIDADVLIAWGPGEESVRDTIVSGSSGAARPLPPTSLQELAVALDNASLVITTDSGPKHIAVAEGTPTLTLFGSTNPIDWQPPMAIHQALTNQTECHPCDLLVCDKNGHPCLRGLTPETVADLAVEMLR